MMTPTGRTQQDLGFIRVRSVTAMGADLCLTFGDDERGRLRSKAVLRVVAGRGIPFPRGGPGYWENFGNFMYQTMHFGEYLCDKWSTKLSHLSVLNTDVEAFLNLLFTRQLYNVGRENDIIEKLHTHN